MGKLNIIMEQTRQQLGGVHDGKYMFVIKDDIRYVLRYI